MAYEDYLLANEATGLLGYWKLDEPTGTVADDAHTSNLNGTIAGTPATRTAPGIAGSLSNAIQWDSDSYVQLEPTPGSALRASQFTVACWFKRMGDGTVTSIGSDVGTTTVEPMVTKGYGIGEGLGQNVTFFLGVNQSGANRTLFGGFEEVGNGTTAIGHAIIGSTNFAADTTGWHFAVFTYDGSNLHIYLDGSENATAVASAVGPDNTSQCIAAVASALNTTAVAGPGRFNGCIGHVAIWNRALSGTSISNLYTQGTTPIPPTATLVTTTPTAPTATLVIQLVAPGSTINDSTVSGADIQLRKDGVLLTENTDYQVEYDTATDRITLRKLPLAQTFQPGAYQITLNPS